MHPRHLERTLIIICSPEVASKVQFTLIVSPNAERGAVVREDARPGFCINLPSRNAVGREQAMADFTALWEGPS